MRTIRVLLSWCIALASGAALADQTATATTAELRAVTDQVMAKVGAGDIDGGLTVMRPYTVIPPAEFEAMQGQVKLQSPALTQRFGASVGSEFVKEVRVGDSLVAFTYIAKFDHHAMRWVFYCYHAKAGWVVDTFRFDDIVALFQ